MPDRLEDVKEELKVHSRVELQRNIRHGRRGKTDTSQHKAKHKDEGERGT